MRQPGAVRWAQNEGGKSNWDTTNFFARQEVQKNEGIEEKVLLKVKILLKLHPSGLAVNRKVTKKLA